MLGRSVPRVVLLVAALVVGYLLFTTATTALKSYRLANDEQDVRREIAGLERSREELLAIREYLSSDEYIEGVARRTLGLVKPGETLVTVSSPEEEAEEPPDEEQPAGQPWWKALFGP